MPADLAVEKAAFSAFYMSRFDWVLARAGLCRLLVCGIINDGGVASTVRDVQVRDYDGMVLEDGCTAFSPEAHRTAIEELSRSYGPL